MSFEQIAIACLIFIEAARVIRWAVTRLRRYRAVRRDQDVRREASRMIEEERLHEVGDAAKWGILRERGFDADSVDDDWLERVN